METALDGESNEIVEKSDENSSSESSDDVEPEEEIVTRPLSEKEKNEISAKILRAELMGNEEMCEKLKAELATGRVSEKRVKQKSNKIGDERGDEEEQIILRKDRHGNVFPLQQSSGRYDDLSSRKSKKKVIKTHDEKGERTMYFESDSNTSLKAMVEEERMTSSADHMSMMAKLSGKITASQDDYALDDEFVQVVATKGLSSKEEARKREKAISAQKQREQQLTSCKYCFGNPNLSKHLIISIGKQVYLALPRTSSLTVGHCLIIPRNHLMGQTYFDEDVIEEVKNFKKTLVKMFKENDEDVIFMETCKYLHHENHTTIECVPVPQDVGDTAPIYFKKALQECDTEWSQNKKIVDIKSTVARAIPKGLPYFSVEFGTSGGYGHVIEDEASFPFYFGKEIIGGVLDVEPRLWRKPPKESFEKHKKKVLKFAEQWKKFDFT